MAHPQPVSHGLFCRWRAGWAGHKLLRVLPVVLHHGLFGFGNLRVGPLQLSYFRGIDRAIAQHGHAVLHARVHPTGSIQRRARQLKETILRQLDAAGLAGCRVVLIGHSMGGLDARWMIAHLGMADRVAALLTVCTPHRGSPYADACVRNLGQRLGAARLLAAMHLDLRGIADLTTDSCRRFNEQTPDDPRVRYYSISAARPWHLIPPFLLPCYRVVHQAEGDNDGLVSVQSAIWGQHLGTWPADHLHAVNRRMVIEMKNPTGDVTGRYLEALGRVVSDLGTGHGSQA